MSNTNRYDAPVGAVVLSYRTGARLADTVSVALASASPLDALLVVDNASGDDTLSLLRDRLPAIEVLELDDNLGYGEAMNRGAAALIDRGCELLLFLTHETVVTAGLAGALRDRMVDRADLGIVGPLLGWASDHDLVWSAGGALTRVRRKARHHGAGQRMTDWIGNGPREVAWLDGACLMARAAAFTAVGGFREDLFLYWEDVDLCRRMHESGFAIECVPAAVAYQQPSMTPPYLDARNRALVLGRSGAAATALDLTLHAVADPLRGRGLGRVRLGVSGLHAALAGGLDHELAVRRRA